MRGIFISRRGSLSAPVIKHDKFVLSFYSILINVCMYRNWCEGISNATVLSLAGKATVVAEKRSIALRCMYRFSFGWTFCISDIPKINIMVFCYMVPCSW
jgi:hypothetical protein